MPDEFDDQKREVFVLGAGFTKAFLPDAPLMVDDYDAEGLAEKFRGFTHASRILDWERNRVDGRIDIERLMTRLHGLMPYDFDEGAATELSNLLTEVMSNFRHRFEIAMEGDFHSTELVRFAHHCINNQITCITFNYDDILDKALWEASDKWDHERDEPSWHPDSGYGFFCKPAESTIRESGRAPCPQHLCFS